MKKRGLYIIFLMLFVAQSAWAGKEVTFTARARQQVLVGQQFQILFEVNANGRNFTPPADFGGLEILSGPNTSSSSSIQFINGKMSQSYSMTYSYIVMATKPGTITIGPATIKVKGKRHASNTLKISVLKFSSSAKSQTGSPGAPKQNSTGAVSTQTQSSPNTKISNKDVFIKATVNNTRPYLGQQVVVTYRIYTRVPVTNLSINKVASFKGFWSKDLLGNSSSLQQHNETINGQKYVVAVIRKLALIPQQTGKLVIDPMELDCAVQIRAKSPSGNSGNPFNSFFNTPFFNQNVRNVKKTLVSNALHFKVKQLPARGKPSCFSGAVGDYTFNSSINKTDLTTNDALTLDITVSGRGNIELISAPQVKFPSDFETYDPKISTKINKSGNGVSGTNKFDYLAIPRTAGDFTVKPVKFCFFNPKDKKYHVYQTKTYHIHVKKGKGMGVTYSTTDQQGIHILGRDIRHIKEGAFDLRPANDFLFGTTLYYVLLALPIVLLLIVLLLWNTLKKRKANVSRAKNRKAQKIARSRLTLAQKMKKQGNDRAFYDEIAQALWGYISDKFNLQKANLSMDSVKELLEQKQVAPETIQAFMDTLNSIEYARFAPGDTKGKMENIYTEALHAIMQAEKSLK